jgi:hypothetical protein
MRNRARPHARRDPPDHLNARIPAHDDHNAVRRYSRDDSPERARADADAAWHQRNEDMKRAWMTP